MTAPVRTSSQDFFDEYVSPLWNAAPDSYLNDCWRRLEMFYSAAIPIPANFGAGAHDVTTTDRLLSFDSLLRSHYQSTSRRPHFLYGSHESATLRDPILLPPFDVSYFDRYCPSYEPGLQHLAGRGAGQAEQGEGGRRRGLAEVELIVALTEEVKLLLQYVRHGYQGDVDPLGRMHGRGTMYYPNGHIYEGEWKDGLRHGRGTYRFHTHADSDILLVTERNYDGENDNGRLNDSVYEGEWREGLMWGRGTLTCSSGMTYTGSLILSPLTDHNPNTCDRRLAGGSPTRQRQGGLCRQWRGVRGGLGGGTDGRTGRVPLRLWRHVQRGVQAGPVRGHGPVPALDRRVAPGAVARRPHARQRRFPLQEWNHFEGRVAQRQEDHHLIQRGNTLSLYGERITKLKKCRSHGRWVRVCNRALG